MANSTIITAAMSDETRSMLVAMQEAVLNMKEIVKCAICWGTLKQPVIASCGHNFCTECYDMLNMVSTVEQKMTCPQCKNGWTRRGISRNLVIEKVIKGYLDIVEKFNAIVRKTVSVRDKREEILVQESQVPFDISVAVASPSGAASANLMFNTPSTYKRGLIDNTPLSKEHRSILRSVQRQLKYNTPQIVRATTSFSRQTTQACQTNIEENLSSASKESRGCKRRNSENINEGERGTKRKFTEVIEDDGQNSNYDRMREWRRSKNLSIINAMRESGLMGMIENDQETREVISWLHSGMITDDNSDSKDKNDNDGEMTDDREVMENGQEAQNQMEEDDDESVVKRIVRISTPSPRSEQNDFGDELMAKNGGTQNNAVMEEHEMDLEQAYEQNKTVLNSSFDTGLIDTTKQVEQKLKEGDTKVDKSNVVTEQNSFDRGETITPIMGPSSTVENEANYNPWILTSNQKSGIPLLETVDGQREIDDHGNELQTSQISDQPPLDSDVAGTSSHEKLVENVDFGNESSSFDPELFEATVQVEQELKKISMSESNVDIEKQGSLDGDTITATITQTPVEDEANSQPASLTATQKSDMDMLAAVDPKWLANSQPASLTATQKSDMDMLAAVDPKWLGKNLNDMLTKDQIGCIVQNENGLTPSQTSEQTFTMSNSNDANDDEEEEELLAFVDPAIGVNGQSHYLQEDLEKQGITLTDANMDVPYLTTSNHSNLELVEDDEDENNELTASQASDQALMEVADYQSDSNQTNNQQLTASQASDQALMEIADYQSDSNQTNNQQLTASQASDQALMEIADYQSDSNQTNNQQLTASQASDQALMEIADYQSDSNQTNNQQSTVGPDSGLRQSRLFEDLIDENAIDETNVAEHSTVLAPDTMPMEYDEAVPDSLERNLDSVSSPPRQPLKQSSAHNTPSKNVLPGPDPMDVVLLTSHLSKEIMDKFQKTFNLNVVSKKADRVTHVVVQTNDDMNMETAFRTYKYFWGIAAKKYVLSQKWIIDSLAANRLLPEEDYEIVCDLSRNGQHKDYPGRRSRLDPGKLFEGFTFFLSVENAWNHSPFGSMLKRALMLDILDLVGASVVSELRLFPKKVRGQTYKSFILLPYKASQDEAWTSMGEELSLRYNVEAIMADWIIDCITGYYVDMDIRSRFHVRQTPKKNKSTAEVVELSDHK